MYVRSCAAATSFIWHYRHLFKVSFLLMSEEEEGTCVDVLELKLNMTLETLGTTFSVLLDVFLNRQTFAGNLLIAVILHHRVLHVITSFVFS